MFTAIIRTRSEPLALAATLGPLVRGVVQGLIGSAILVAENDTPDLHQIADSSGCRVLIAQSWSEGFARAVAQTGGAPLIVLDEGIMLPPDFWPVLADIAPLLADRPAVTRPEKASNLLAGAKRWMRQHSGGVDAESALLLPIATARGIAQKKHDPFRTRYGAALVRLNAVTMRVQSPNL